jgi:large subunit ribosomal protein L5
VDADSLNNVQGMDITIVTTAGDDAKAQALLLGLGLPFQQGAGTGGDPVRDR